MTSKGVTPILWQKNIIPNNFCVEQGGAVYFLQEHLGLKGSSTAVFSLPPLPNEEELFLSDVSGCFAALCTVARFEQIHCKAGAWGGGTPSLLHHGEPQDQAPGQEVPFKSSKLQALWLHNHLHKYGCSADFFQ